MYPGTACNLILTQLGRSCCSVALEELSVRAGIALNQKRVVNDLLLVNASEKEDFEDEYQAMCAQVVSAQNIPFYAQHAPPIYSHTTFWLHSLRIR